MRWGDGDGRVGEMGMEGGEMGRRVCEMGMEGG